MGLCMCNNICNDNNVRLLYLRQIISPLSPERRGFDQNKVILTFSYYAYSVPPPLQKQPVRIKQDTLDAYFSTQHC